MSYFPEELQHVDFKALEAIYQNIEVQVENLLEVLAAPPTKIDDKKTIEENSQGATLKSHQNYKKVAMIMGNLQSLADDLVFSTIKITEFDTIPDSAKILPDSNRMILSSGEIVPRPFHVKSVPRPYQVKDLLKNVEMLVNERELPIHSPSRLKLIQLKFLLKLIGSLKKYNLKDEKRFEALKFHAVHDIMQAMFKIKTCDFCETLMKVHSDVLVISVGSAGLSISQQCPSFAKTLSKNVVVSVFNIDPAFDKSGFNDELSDKRLNVFQFKGAFGSLSEQRSVEATDRSAEKIRTNIDEYPEAEAQLQGAMQEALALHLNQLGTSIVLIDNTGVFLNKSLIEFCNKHADKFGSQLAIISCGGLANRPAFVYSKDFVIGSDKEKIKAALIPAWEEIAPGKYNKETGSFQYDPSFDLETKNLAHYYESRMLKFQEKFQSIGNLYRNLDSIPAESLFLSQPRARFKF